MFGKLFLVTFLDAKRFLIPTIGGREAVNRIDVIDDLPDPRSNVHHLPRFGGGVLVMSIGAVVSLADGPTAIAQWAELHEAWLAKHLALPHGIPGRDTCRRVLGLLDPVIFQQCFHACLDGLYAADHGAPPGERRIAVSVHRDHGRGAA